jgi:hypothetical protein
MLAFFIITTVALAYFLIRKTFAIRDLDDFTKELIAECVKYGEERDNAYRCIDLLIEEQTRELQDAHFCLEMVLEANKKDCNS